MNKNLKKTKSRKYILGIILIILLGFIVLVWWAERQNPAIDDPNLHTLSTGTQLKFENLFIGLGGIQGNSAILVFHPDQTNDETRKTVSKGDKFEVYGYTIEVKAVEKAFSPSALIGASHGDVKFLINKKEPI